MFNQYRGLRKELYVLFIGRVMTNFGSMIMPMLTLILNKKLGMNASEVADYLLVFSLISIPALLLAGKLSDRFNKRNIIIVCDIISVCCYIICGIKPLNISSIIILEIAAIFQTIEGPAYDTLVADLTLPKDRERAYSLNYLGVNLGLVLSPTIGGLLFNNYLWLAFIINGVSILFSTVLIFFLIKDISREESEEDTNEYENELDNKTNSLSFILSNKVLMVYIFALIFHEVVYYQFNYLMPLDLATVHGENGSVFYGSLTSLNCIVVVLFTASLTRMFVSIKEASKLNIGHIFTLLGVLIFSVFVNSIVSSYIAMFVFTIGEIITSIGLSPFLSKRIPANYRGRITSILSVMSSASVALCTKYIGVVYDSSGSSSAWKVVYIAGIIALIMYLIVQKLDKKYYKNLY